MRYAITTTTNTRQNTERKRELPAIQLLCVEQEQQTFKDHTKKFLQLPCLINFPDHLLCLFFRTSLNDRTKACLPGAGFQGDFAEFVEWVLVTCGTPNTICPN